MIWGFGTHFSLKSLTSTGKVAENSDTYFIYDNDNNDQKSILMMIFLFEIKKMKKFQKNLTI